MEWSTHHIFQTDALSTSIQFAPVALPIDERGFDGDHGTLYKGLHEPKRNFCITISFQVRCITARVKLFAEASYTDEKLGWNQGILCKKL